MVSMHVGAPMLTDNFAVSTPSSCMSSLEFLSQSTGLLHAKFHCIMKLDHICTARAAKHRLLPAGAKAELH